ncbi:MAG TPA: MBL fold metallo-hydrolase [Thermoflexales bacterium]|nr:MBL fold metallo-hydrolase [Thermoflexales bacterium]HQZ22577.1 MBL fold metallo-hydrolase [Thermoflexales bacterium]
MTAKITLLSDGHVLADGGGAFGLVPRDRWMKLLPPDERNRVPQELWCVLVEADGKRILIDAGVGGKNLDKLAGQYDIVRPRGTLMDDLARRGFAPADIDIVIQTHLHGDHVGWALAEQGGQLVRGFPNAHYFVQQTEYADATHTNERTRNTYFPENYIKLVENGWMTLLDGVAQITPSVRVLPTPGHTVGHQSVIIEGVDSIVVSPSVLPEFVEGRQGAEPRKPRTVIMLGDVACYQIHFARLPWVTAYDVLPLITIDTKRALQKWALEHDAFVITAHDTQIPVGRLVKDAKGFVNIVSAMREDG